MPTTAAPAAPAAGAPPAKKTTVPKDMIARLAKGDDPVKAGAAPAAGAAAAPSAPAGGAPAAPAAGAPAEGAAAAGAAVVKKLPKKNLPDIPPAGAPAAAGSTPATVDDVRKAIADSKTATGASAAGGAPVLRPEDQQDLELATFAATQHPDRYSELPTRLSQFFTKRDEFIATKAKEFGGENSPEFRDFLKGDEFRGFIQQNAPNYQRGDSKKIYEEFIEHRGAQRALATIQPELDKVRRKQDEIEQAPKINQMVANGVRHMLAGDDPAQQDSSLVEFSKDPVSFTKANEIEGGIIAQTAGFFKDAMEETLRYTSGLSEPGSAGRPTPTQLWIENFINSKEVEIERLYPNGVQIPDGKILVSDSQMKRLKAAKVTNLGDYRTLFPNEICGMIAVEGRNEVKRRLADQRALLERSGFKRVAVGAAAAPSGAKPANSPAPASPMAASSPARGAAGGTPAGKQEQWFEKYTKG